MTTVTIITIIVMVIMMFMVVMTDVVDLEEEMSVVQVMHTGSPVNEPFIRAFFFFSAILFKSTKF